MNVEIITASVEASAHVDEAIVELGDLQLTLVGGGIGETILVAPKG